MLLTVVTIGDIFSVNHVQYYLQLEHELSIKTSWTEFDTKSEIIDDGILYFRWQKIMLWFEKA